jgi:hypothetical protein
MLALDGGQFGQDLSPFTGSGVGQAAVEVALRRSDASRLRNRLAAFVSWLIAVPP